MTAIIGPGVLNDPTMTRAGLDKLAPGRKVLLREFTGHAIILSSAALAAINIPDNDEDPVGGWYERDSSGKINGKLHEYAAYDAMRRIAMSTPDIDATQQLADYGSQALRLGITSIQNMSFVTRARFVQLAKASHFPLRVRVIRFGITDARGRETAAADPAPAASGLITVSGTKWILDGTPIEEGAALRESYHQGTHDVGRLNFNQDQMKAILDEAFASKDQLLLHVAGDLTADTVLKMMQAHPEWNGRRLRFEHGDGLLPDLRDQAAALGIVVVQNPSHFAALRDYPSPEFMPLKSLGKIPLAFGSDGAPNPYTDIVDAANHPREAESISREAALDAYTRGAAYAEGTEKEKGMIAKGMLADLAVLSQDIFHAHANTLDQTQSLLTIVDGKVAWVSVDLR
jgi:predicted amidohydrolase YtcJ